MKNQLAQRTRRATKSNSAGSGSLLPYNATKFERAVEQAIKYNVDANRLAGFKFSDSGNLRLSLIWEYSLAQVNVDDLKTKITEGLKFHRLAGTPYSLRQALSWYNLNDVIIEEENPGRHFAEFQVGLKEIPNNFEVEKIIQVSKDAAPLRSRLSRMYNDLYDIRRFILDESNWGDFLSDYSGNRIYDGSPKFSFGRVNNFEMNIVPFEYNFFIERQHFSFAENTDNYKLDWTILGDNFWGTPNYGMWRYAVTYHFNSDYIGDKLPANIFQPRKIALASITLSENAILDDLNTCFSSGYEELEEEPFVLSYSFLSEHPIKQNRVLVTERKINKSAGDAVNTFTPSAVRGYRSRIICSDCSSNFEVESYRTRDHFMAAQYPGNNTWLNEKHPDFSWTEQKNYMGNIAR